MGLRRLGTFSMISVCLGLSAGYMSAAGVCVPHAGEAVDLITDTATAFCVGTSGYSKEWYNTPGITTTPFSLLGDSAQFLTYHIQGGGYVSQWLSPEVAGIATSTGFSTFGGLSVLNNVATSSIRDAQVQVAISSTTINNNIKQTFTVTNIGAGVIDMLELITYLQYFPYGQANPTKGTLNYEPVPTIENTYVDGLWGHGSVGQLGFVREGGVCGGVGFVCTTPDHYKVDTPANVRAVMAAMILSPGTLTLGDGQTSLDMNPNQAAGALSWRINNLNLALGSGSATFTVELVPEPGTAALFLIATACFVIRRRFIA